jgi:hypothetical protein
MNWTFYLSCDRIRPQDCIFSPIQRAPPSDSDYSLRLRQVSSPFRSPEVGPSFDVLSIMPPHTQVHNLKVLRRIKKKQAEYIILKY